MYYFFEKYLQYDSILKNKFVPLFVLVFNFQECYS